MQAGAGAQSAGPADIGGGPDMMLSGPGSLRQGIGTRMLPNGQSALAGLMRVY